VKVHVREIMRKLGVSNRTQVAIAASHVCSNSPIELVSADTSMALKPSISH
jgi:regulatory LuxR family protein